MADVLIKGMDMLPEGCAYDVRIRGNGDVVDRVTGRVMGHAIEVPSHGVLKDIDVLNDAIIEAVRLGEITGGEAGFFKAILTNAPRVIDASKH